MHNGKFRTGRVSTFPKRTKYLYSSKKFYQGKEKQNKRKQNREKINNVIIIIIGIIGKIIIIMIIIYSKIEM